MCAASTGVASYVERERSTSSRAQVQCSVCSAVSCATPAAAVSHLVCSQCQVSASAPTSPMHHLHRPPNNAFDRSCFAALNSLTGAQVTLRYPSGAASVRCAVCSCVTAATSGATLPPPLQQSLQPATFTQTVVVENPGEDIAIGVARV